MSDVETRAILTPAEDADLEPIAGLVNTSYRGVVGWTTEAAYLTGARTSADNLRRDLAAKPSASLQTTRDFAGGPILGVVWLEPAAGDAWYIGMLTVRPDLQDRKLGRSLLEAAEAFIVAQGGRRARMTVVNVRDTLIAWYQRRGYRLTGESEPFPYEGSLLGAPTRDDLRFDVMEKRLTL